MITPVTSTTEETGDPARLTPPEEDHHPARELVGTVIGQYRISRRIGKGGMGTVYEAVHTEIGQRAAIKVLNPNLAGKERYIRRFIDEAKLVSRVGHPGLIKVFDFGKTSDREPYILMEFLEGEELWDRIKPLHERGELLPLRDSLRICRQVASALAAVHAQSIIHRDLKPENVFLVRDPDSPSGERAKVLDFGIAKLTEGDGVVRRTTTGTALGTPTYMSPEQCEGSPQISDRADVYALGVMLYELAAGKPPFQGASMGALMRMHIVVLPPPLPPSVPAEVRALIESMLSKVPEERPAMTAVVTRLDDIMGGSQSSTALPMLQPPPSLRLRAPRPRWLVPASAGLALALTGLITWLVTRSTATPGRPDLRSVVTASGVDAPAGNKTGADLAGRPDRAGTVANTTSVPDPGGKGAVTGSRTDAAGPAAKDLKKKPIGPSKGKVGKPSARWGAPTGKP